MKATVSWEENKEENKMEFCRNSIATGGKLNSEQSRYLVIRIEELEATLKTLASQAMYAAGYTKKGDWKNETL